MTFDPTQPIADFLADGVTAITPTLAANVRKILRVSHVTKYALSESFVLNGWRYWTDGCAAIRARSAEADTTDFNYPAEVAGYAWPTDWTDATEFPRKPSRILLEQQRRAGWDEDGDFYYGELEEASYDLGSILIDPRYFMGIVQFTTNPRYLILDVPDAAKALSAAVFVKADECEAVIMKMSDSQELVEVSEREMPEVNHA